MDSEHLEHLVELVQMLDEHHFDREPRDESKLTFRNLKSKPVPPDHHCVEVGKLWMLVDGA